MKKILGIIGSGRKLGNCELIIKAIYSNFEESCKLKLIRLPNFKIEPCKGCYKCLFNKQKCEIKDDVYKVLDAITEADALILAAPTYFLGAHSSLKCFIDRGLSFYPYIEQLWGKPSIGIALAGIKGKEGSTLLGIENFLKFIFSEIKQTQVVYGALPGEVLIERKNKKIIKELAIGLFDKPIQKQSPHCSLCGGNTFQFKSNIEATCMLCSNTGTTRINRDGNIVISMKDKGKHQLFLTKENVIQHKRWLVNMKNRFLSSHKLLKTTSKDYMKIGSWINP